MDVHWQTPTPFLGAVAVTDNTFFIVMASGITLWSLWHLTTRGKRSDARWSRWGGALGGMIGVWLLWHLGM
jgi:hypothetical protein